MAAGRGLLLGAAAGEAAGGAAGGAAAGGEAEAQGAGAQGAEGAAAATAAGAGGLGGQLGGRPGGDALAPGAPLGPRPGFKDFSQVLAGAVQGRLLDAQGFPAQPSLDFLLRETGPAKLGRAIEDLSREVNGLSKAAAQHLAPGRLPAATVEDVPDLVPPVEERLRAALEALGAMQRRLGRAGANVSELRRQLGLRDLGHPLPKGQPRHLSRPEPQAPGGEGEGESAALPVQAAEKEDHASAENESAEWAEEAAEETAPAAAVLLSPPNRRRAGPEQPLPPPARAARVRAANCQRGVRQAGGPGGWSAPRAQRSAVAARAARRAFL